MLITRIDLGLERNRWHLTMTRSKVSIQMTLQRQASVVHMPRNHSRVARRSFRIKLKILRIRMPIQRPSRKKVWPSHPRSLATSTETRRETIWLSWKRSPSMRVSRLRAKCLNPWCPMASPNLIHSPSRIPRHPSNSKMSSRWPYLPMISRSQHPINLSSGCSMSTKTLIDQVKWHHRTERLISSRAYQTSKARSRQTWTHAKR